MSTLDESTNNPSEDSEDSKDSGEDPKYVVKPSIGWQWTFFIGLLKNPPTFEFVSDNESDDEK